jgi:hypothetical protein
LPQLTLSILIFMPSITEQEDELFDRWSLLRPNLVRDGVVDEAAYTQSMPRVVYVLKEVNDRTDGGGWDLRAVLKDATRRQTWDNVARWTQALRAPDRDFTWDEVEVIDTASRRAALASIAAVNLKKSPGGYVADGTSLDGIAKADVEFLTEQISLYSADVIVCCGTGALFCQLVNLPEADSWSRTRRGVPYRLFGRGQACISFVHPEARVSSNILFFAFFDAVREITAARHRRAKEALPLA